MPARVDTLPVNKKQIVTAWQSHLWRFNTQTHICNSVCVLAARKKGHNRPLILIYTLRATHPSQPIRIPADDPLVSLISVIFLVCRMRSAYKWVGQATHSTHRHKAATWSGNSRFILNKHDNFFNTISRGLISQVSPPSQPAEWAVNFRWGRSWLHFHTHSHMHLSSAAAWTWLERRSSWALHFSGAAFLVFRLPAAC